ncbi:MAG: membrane protein insertase YidC [Desulfobacteraceae bacterium]|nr:membrane protein insertase YidC [Desulfobacteraceae bacterium]
METQRAFIAVILSLLILLGYQHFFAPPPPESPAGMATNTTPSPGKPAAPEAQPAATEAVADQANPASPPPLNGKDIPVTTRLYRAVVSENGGAFTSFRLKDYRESIAKDSPPKELILAHDPGRMPLDFFWGNAMPTRPLLYTAAQDQIVTTPGGQASLVMVATPQPGLSVTKKLTFSDDSYRMELAITVQNSTPQALRGAPLIASTYAPFSPELQGKRAIFSGPAALLDGAKLEEVQPESLRKDGPKTITGAVTWAAYEDSYFLSAIVPHDPGSANLQLSLAGKDEQVTSILGGPQEVIPAGGEKTYNYTLFVGPKKLSILQKTGSDLDKIVNFGWFDALAKPTLFLLNFLHRYTHNYGVAIILVTVLFKLLFWPISHKGMKSMKTMQKIQPKMAKLREKYKDQPEQLNQEIMTLYKTYKINPLGGCLPMILQIPVFFSLYKVLLQTVELRHAPFMLWITDLSAPDRLGIGLHIPGLNGIPVLTLLMGASMFLQQKMSPTSGDPTQAKVMMFLPVIFTFMFLNFASGLVLYWFVNNLLSIGQQYLINRSVEP